MARRRRQLSVRSKLSESTHGAVLHHCVQVPSGQTAGVEHWPVAGWAGEAEQQRVGERNGRVAEPPQRMLDELRKAAARGESLDGLRDQGDPVRMCAEVCEGQEAISAGLCILRAHQSRQVRQRRQHGERVGLGAAEALKRARYKRHVAARQQVRQRRLEHREPSRDRGSALAECPRCKRAVCRIRTLHQLFEGRSCASRQLLWHSERHTQCVGAVVTGHALQQALQSQLPTLVALDEGSMPRAAHTRGRSATPPRARLEERRAHVARGEQVEENHER
eukprot:6817492-Prymnesium_polylepis.1